MDATGLWRAPGPEDILRVHLGTNNDHRDERRTTVALYESEAEQVQALADRFGWNKRQVIVAAIEMMSVVADREGL